MTSPRVDTRNFEFWNGEKPSGRGYWAFFFDRDFDVTKAFWYLGSFAEAKKAAVEEARRREVHDVFVGS